MYRPLEKLYPLEFLTIDEESRTLDPEAEISIVRDENVADLIEGQTCRFLD